MTDLWPWVALLLLGALHGLNPGMGWLFAVALGMQQEERRAVWRALLPLTAGHALAIVVAVALAMAAGLVMPPDVLRWVVIGALAFLGIRQLQRHRHPRLGGMRVGARDLVMWSFLVATAHGAGLMAVPFAAEAGALRAPPAAQAAQGGAPVPASPTGDAAPRHAHAAHGLAGVRAPASQDRLKRISPSLGAIMATLVHTLGYILVTGLLAIVVYERAGLRVLRRAWVNLDVIWAGSLLLTALALTLW
ncbi:MAG: hypothetical protein ACLGIK_10405 [Gemmatimonadota bacterium]